MRIVKKNVYYCDFCRKHGLSRPAMEKHERHCTLNPERTCRWHLLEYTTTRSLVYAGNQLHTAPRALPRWLRLRRPITDDVIAKLRDYCQGCPACMLAAVRQAQLNYVYDYDVGCAWRYEEEVTRYREDEKFHWEEEERREIEAGFI